jgi:hypothetical protein
LREQKALERADVSVDKLHKKVADRKGWEELSGKVQPIGKVNEVATSTDVEARKRMVNSDQQTIQLLLRDAAVVLALAQLSEGYLGLVEGYNRWTEPMSGSISPRTSKKGRYRTDVSADI